MNANDLLDIIGETPEQYVLDAAEYKTNTKLNNSRFLLIAAIVGTTLLLMGSGIASLVSMRVGEVKLNVRSWETQAAETIVTEKTGEKVEFEKTKDVYVELGSYYPQEIPEGYTMTFVSEGAPLQNQRIDYEDETGHVIHFGIYIGDPSSDVEVYDIVSKKDININGQDGILYEQKNDYRMLVWVNESQGYGFALKTNDAAVDLVAMAKSTDEGETLVPTRTPSTMKAIEQLGDYYPEYLPEGYVEQGTMGCPLEEGGGWYSYVRKWFINKTENTQIYFEIETYAIDTESGYTDDAKTICSFFIPGYERGIAVYEEVEINGMIGLATENHIAWADPEKHVVYHLYSEDITGDALLKVAQSIRRE